MSKPSGARRVRVTFVLSEDVNEYVTEDIVRQMFLESDVNDEIIEIEHVEFPDGIKGELSDDDLD